MHGSKMNIVYTSDENYYTQMYISIYSVCRNASDNCYLIFHIICSDFDEEKKQKLLNLSNEFDCEMQFYESPKLPVNVGIIDEESKVKYYRIAIASILSSEINKVLYIDCDTIIMSSIKEFYNISIDNKILCGVRDIIKLDERKSIGLGEDDIYINSGVLLINLDEWKKQNVEEKCFNYMMNSTYKFPYFDQDVINNVCNGEMIVVPPKYNVITPIFEYSKKQLEILSDLDDYYSQFELDEAINTPVIIHYAGIAFDRPWFKECDHKKKNEYLNLWKETGLPINIKSANIPFTKKIERVMHHTLPFPIFYKLKQLKYKILHM